MMETARRITTRSKAFTMFLKQCITCFPVRALLHLYLQFTLRDTVRTILVKRKNIILSLLVCLHIHMSLSDSQA